MNIKKILFIFTVLLFIGCDESPNLSFDQTTHDFGTIKKKAKVTHVFKFTNTGKKTLIINQVNPTCGCTAALLSEKEIKPGKTGQIEITYTAGNFTGKISKTILVLSNDPGNRTTELTIYGQIK